MSIEEEQGGLENPQQSVQSLVWVGQGFLPKAEVLQRIKNGEIWTLPETKHGLPHDVRRAILKAQEELFRTGFPRRGNRHS